MNSALYVAINFVFFALKSTGIFFRENFHKVVCSLLLPTLVTYSPPFLHFNIFFLPSLGFLIDFSEKKTGSFYLLLTYQIKYYFLWEKNKCLPIVYTITLILAAKPWHNLILPHCNAHAII